jgi:hypothetical protein
LSRRGQLNALGGLIFLQDSVSNQQFLVDTGAAVSVFPHRSSAASLGPLLSGGDGKPISAWGKVTKKLNFGLHTFIVSFIFAAVSKPILGIDFLSAHRLLEDPFSRAVLFASSLEPVGRTVAAAPSRFAASISRILPAVHSPLSSFPSIVGNGKGTPGPRHSIRHFFETSGRPVFTKARCLDPDKLKIAEAEFRSLKLQELFAGPTLHGRLLFTWFPRRMVHGDPAVTIPASTPSPLLTGTPSPPCWIFQPNSMVASFSHVLIL